MLLLFSMNFDKGHGFFLSPMLIIEYLYIISYYGDTNGKYILFKIQP